MRSKHSSQGTGQQRRHGSKSQSGQSHEANRQYMRELEHHGNKDNLTKMGAGAELQHITQILNFLFKYSDLYSNICSISVTPKCSFTLYSYPFISLSFSSASFGRPLSRPFVF